MELALTRKIRLPDRTRLARLARCPELGPRILFFSGGSALGPLARRITAFTHNSIHLITPFDSGGSSAELRRAFNMPAVGDLRNRMMSLADETVFGNPQIRDLFAFRLGRDRDARDLSAILESMIDGRHPLVAGITDPMRKIIRTHLGFFREAMPDDFDLAGASVGNLVLTGGYLNNNRHLDPVIYLFSKLAEVRGVVRPIVNRDLHLAAELADGRLVIGQHLITGREAPPLDSPITGLRISASPRELIPAAVRIRAKIVDLIRSADLICYPIGSFYTSLLANLLPQGVAEAIAANDCPKIFVPNSRPDPELVGGSVGFMVKTLMATLKTGARDSIPDSRLLNFVLLDSSRGAYPGSTEIGEVADPELKVIDTDLINTARGTDLDPDKLLGVILSLA